MAATFSNSLDPDLHLYWSLIQAFLLSFGNVSERLLKRSQLKSYFSIYDLGILQILGFIYLEHPQHQGPVFAVIVYRGIAIFQKLQFQVTI